MKNRVKKPSRELEMDRASAGRCGCCGTRRGCRCSERGHCLVCARCPRDCRCPNLGEVTRWGVVVCVAPKVPWRDVAPYQERSAKRVRECDRDREWGRRWGIP